MHELDIASRRVADDSGAHMIAELGHNHQGRLRRAEPEPLQREGTAADAHAAALQKRGNKSLVTKAMQHRQALEFGRGEYVHPAELAPALNLDLFSMRCA